MYVLQLLKPGPNLCVPIPGTRVSGGRLEPRAQATQKSPAMASRSPSPVLPEPSQTGPMFHSTARGAGRSLVVSQLNIPNFQPFPAGLRGVVF